MRRYFNFGRFMLAVGALAAGTVLMGAPGGAHAGNSPASSDAKVYIINSPLPPFDEDIPADNNHLHFGAGQSEARVELPPGTHTLQLLMGDHNHVPHDPPLMSKKITVIVP